MSDLFFYHITFMVKTKTMLVKVDIKWCNYLYEKAYARYKRFYYVVNTSCYWILNNQITKTYKDIKSESLLHLFFNTIYRSHSKHENTKCVFLFIILVIILLYPYITFPHTYGKRNLSQRMSRKYSYEKLISPNRV